VSNEVVASAKFCLTHHPRTSYDVVQREEILAGRKSRSQQLEKLLVDAKERLSDHISGIRILTEAEKSSLEKKIDVFSKKLDTMKVEPDEREVKRILERERLIRERQAERIKERSSEL
jgi:hypothetical protein